MAKNVDYFQFLAAKKKKRNGGCIGIECEQRLLIRGCAVGRGKIRVEGRAAMWRKQQTGVGGCPCYCFLLLVDP